MKNLTNNHNLFPSFFHFNKSLRFVIFFLAFGFISNCDIINRTELDKKEKQSARNANTLLFLLNTEATSDCIFCTDTQANQGSCSCYSNISLGTCQGLTQGKGKSNSYRISCEALTEIGIWTSLEDESKFCPYQSCPVEAYRAAFTTFGE